MADGEAGSRHLQTVIQNSLSTIEQLLHQTDELPQQRGQQAAVSKQTACSTTCASNGNNQLIPEMASLVDQYTKNLSDRVSRLLQTKISSSAADDVTSRQPTTTTALGDVDGEEPLQSYTKL
jgi:hypothetical protein